MLEFQGVIVFNLSSQLSENVQTGFLLMLFSMAILISSSNFNRTKDKKDFHTVGIG